MTADDISSLLSQLSLASPQPDAQRSAGTGNPSPLRVASHGASGPAYVVFVGQQPGVYRSWAECRAQVKGVPHNSYKAYPCFAAAERAYSAAQTRGLVSTAERRAADIRRVVQRQRMESQDLPLCTHFLEDPTSKAMAPEPSRWYVVYAGLQPGVYLTFHECSFLTSGYTGASHESFESLDTALEAMERGLATGKVVKFILQ
ncbi:hypothetical protein BD626DRAFT_548777 [Schizophyllum amplum]|uniref:Ribonuclease H1 N-terminal domain-containing protein n=1 Tax=Schizophyllum amplum TaxID=97359 RepID=A0A550CAZ6_9AGAR|nr:hypothetical protein BD626DRAFT_548777 [Auriculariopsis ampla]